MRTIDVPYAMIRAAVQLTSDAPTGGNCVVFPVKVDWPELQLTEDQMLANAAARACGQPPPHEDRSIFTVRLPLVFPEWLLVKQDDNGVVSFS